VSNTGNKKPSKKEKMERVWITPNKDENLLAWLVCLLSDKEVLHALLATEPQPLPVIRY
jgi:hypothetical protein